MADRQPPDTNLHVSRSATRALDLVDVVVTAGSISLTDAAEQTGIPTSTALRHLKALMSKGWLTRDAAGSFAVGPTFLRLGINAFRDGPWARLTDTALPYLEALAETTQESVYLAVRDGSEAVYVATVESPRAIRHAGWVGRSVPIDGTAIGEALTSTIDPAADIPTFHNVGAMESDVAAVCAPIPDRGQIIGGISVLGPAERLTGEAVEQTAASLCEAAAALAATLSGDGLAR